MSGFAIPDCTHFNVPLLHLLEQKTVKPFSSVIVSRRHNCCSCAFNSLLISKELSWLYKAKNHLPLHTTLIVKKVTILNKMLMRSNTHFQKSLRLHFKYILYGKEGCGVKKENRFCSLSISFLAFNLEESSWNIPNFE